MTQMRSRPKPGLTVGVVGLGFVGGAIKDVLSSMGCSVVGYDKFKDSDEKELLLETDIVFLCLPTVYSETLKAYDKVPLRETCAWLDENKYSGTVLIKSTVEPGTTSELAHSWPSLDLIHNPEFLTAATAKADFASQDHIVLGVGGGASRASVGRVRDFYQKLFPSAKISECTCAESETMKIFANSFYAVKIQFFNEMYTLCRKIGADYDTVRDMIVKNGWVNPMHTNVPGTDGKMSYGGLCFPKDTNALLHTMRGLESPHAVLEATIAERNSMRSDADNCVAGAHSAQRPCT